MEINLLHLIVTVFHLILLGVFLEIGFVIIGQVAGQIQRRGKK